MGIGKSNEAGVSVTKSFSKDVLKIVITGPARENLSVFDIPGIIHNSVDGVTTEGDIELVKEMVQTYIKNERTIILAVIPANVDIATQDILKVCLRHYFV